MLILNAFLKRLIVILLRIIQIFHKQENIKIIFLAVLLIKLFVLTINSVKNLSWTEERMLLTKLLNHSLVSTIIVGKW